jgi:hypothetical protein
MYEKIGFQLTEDYIAILCLAFAIAYFFIGDGKGAFKQTFSSTATPTNKDKVQDQLNVAEYRQDIL